MTFASVPTISPLAAMPGDVVTCDGKGLASDLIKFGEYLRSPPEYRKWSHNALLIDQDDKGEWMVHQATAKGIILSKISDVTNGSYEIIPLTAFPTVNAQPVDREAVIACSERMLGTKYSFVGIASIALNMLTPEKIVFGDSDHVVCSAHVARCMEHGGVWIPRNPYSQTPADNAELAHFGPQATSRLVAPL